MRKRSDFQFSSNLINRGIVENINIYEGNLRDISSLGNALTKADPDVVFHLGAQSYVPASFDRPLETLKTNTIGTANLLEAMRIHESEARFVFAGSSEEYGFVAINSAQVQRGKEKYGEFNPPCDPPEVPIKETNPMRPMSPYGVSKYQGELLTLNYQDTFGLNTVASRAFNHEGAGRGDKFVTSVITKQTAKIRAGEKHHFEIGNVNAFRDWSHVKDIVRGYMTLAENGANGAVYNQGSGTMNSVLTFLLLSAQKAFGTIEYIEIGDEKVQLPVNAKTEIEVFGDEIQGWRMDEWLLNGNRVTLEDSPLYFHTEDDTTPIKLDPERFRPSDVPYLWANADKIKNIGWKSERTIEDIIDDQLNFYINRKRW